MRICHSGVISCAVTYGGERGMLRGGMPMQRAVLLDVRQHPRLVLDVGGEQGPLEERVDEVEHAIRAIRLLHAMLEGQREDRLDA